MPAGPGADDFPVLLGGITLTGQEKDAELCRKNTRRKRKQWGLNKLPKFEKALDSLRSKQT